MLPINLQSSSAESNPPLTIAYEPNNGDPSRGFAPQPPQGNIQPSYQPGVTMQQAPVQVVNTVPMVQAPVNEPKQAPEQHLPPKKEECKGPLCVAITMLVIGFIFGSAGLTFGIIAASSNIREELNALEHTGKEGMCAYNILETTGAISCSYSPERQECSGGKSNSCHTVPASFSCRCPIQYSFSMNEMNMSYFLTTYAASFNQEPSSAETNINVDIARNKYQVNAVSLCFSSKACSRFDCFHEDAGSLNCCLELAGHPSGFSPYCKGVECQANEKRDFACTIDVENGHVREIYGEKLKILHEWNDEHASLFTILGIIMGDIGILSFIIAFCCCRKHRKAQKKAQAVQS